jgi:hypothetical protein
MMRARFEALMAVLYPDCTGSTFHRNVGVSPPPSPPPLDLTRCVDVSKSERNAVKVAGPFGLAKGPRRGDKVM